MMVMSNGGKEVPVTTGVEGVHKIWDGRADKDYYLTHINVSSEGSISFGKAKGRMLLIDGQLPIECRAGLISAGHRLVRGELSETDAFIATGILPIIMFSPQLVTDLGSNPHQFIQHKGYVIALPVKGKADVSGVPIGSANAGSALHRTNIDNPFSQSLFLKEGFAKDYPYKEELLDMIARFSYNGVPVIMSVNLSGICPRLEASAIREVYCAPAIGNKFLQEKFCKDSRKLPMEKWEYNHIFFAGILASCGAPLIFAKCDDRGTLQATRSTAAPSISYTHVPDEIRGVEVSDASLGMAGQVWRRIGDEASGYCELGEVAANS